MGQMNFNAETRGLQSNNGFCTNCGRPVFGYGKFCGFCGAKLITPDNKKTTTISNENIFEAIHANDLGLVKELIASGIDLNKKGRVTDEDGEVEYMSPLWYAFDCDSSYEVQKELIISGANINELLKDKRPLFFAYYRMGGNKYHKLFLLCLKYGADVNCYIGDTPLIMEIMGDEKLFLEVLKKSVDVNVKTKVSHDENTVLSRALRSYSYANRVKYLINAGANVNQKIKAYGNDYCYPLHIAMSLYTNYQNIELLLKAGANINPKDSSGYTPLHYAIGSDKIRKDKENVIKLLIE